MDAASKSKPEYDALKELAALIEEAGLRLTFDPKRDVTLPCVDCGTTSTPRLLVDVGWDEIRRDDITRPLCARCAFKRGPPFRREPSKEK